MTTRSGRRSPTSAPRVISRSGIALGRHRLLAGRPRRATPQSRVVQHIYNLLEQHPGASIPAGRARQPRRHAVSHSRAAFLGHARGQIHRRDNLPPGRPPRAPVRGRADQRREKGRAAPLPLERDGQRTLGQAALLWLLADDTRHLRAAENIYNAEQLEEFAAAPERPPLTSESDLSASPIFVRKNFGLEPEEGKFKGTMELAAAERAQASLERAARARRRPKSEIQNRKSQNRETFSPPRRLSASQARLAPAEGPVRVVIFDFDGNCGHLLAGARDSQRDVRRVWSIASSRRRSFRRHAT